jgi:small subunit ribosomal protein S16
MYKHHLNKGVTKGALTQEQADEKFSTWLSEKESKVSAKIDSISKSAADSAAAAHKREEAVKLDREKAIAERLAPEVEATEEVPEAAADATEEVVEATAETAPEATEETVEAPEVATEATEEVTEAPPEAPEAATEEAVEAKAEETKEEPAVEESAPAEEATEEKPSEDKA